MVLAERFTTDVSFAVRLRDDFSRQWALVGSTRVFVEEGGVEAIENPGKYQVFVDLAGPSFTVHIENKYYFDQVVSVGIAGLDPRQPLVSVTMKPGYAYPFPMGASLIRGRIVDSAGAPIEGAAITAVGSTSNNAGEPDGRFVLYFGPAREEDIVVQNGLRLMKIAGSTAIGLKIEHSGYQAKTVAIGTMTEGETKLLTSPIVLDPI